VRLNAAQAARPPEIRSLKPESGDQPQPEVRIQKTDAEGRRTEAAGQSVERVNQPSEEVGEDAEIAAPTAPESVATDNSAPPPPDDEGYVWPEGATAQAAEPEGAAPAVDKPLPSLDELVKRIPDEARATLEDLFRARFVTARRIPPGSLKS